MYTCVRVTKCVLGDASGCGDCPSGGLFLAGAAGHRHEAEDQGPPNEGGERAARCVFTWTLNRTQDLCVHVCFCVCALKFIGVFRTFLTGEEHVEDVGLCVQQFVMVWFDVI